MSILRRDEDVANEEDVYFNFINSIKSDATKKVYRENINSFMKFCNITKLSDLLKITEPQKQIINYLMSLRKRGLASEVLLRN
jgi:site-specific recombinase XerC